MFVSVVVGLIVVLMVASWLVDRRRRRRNQALDEQGLVSGDQAHQVTATSPSVGAQVNIAAEAVKGGYSGLQG